MLSVIIVGIDDWERYTRPLIADIWTHEPDANIVVVDNASATPYPKGEHIHRTDKRLGYAEALNWGIDRAGDSDWYVVMNNDVRVHKAFTKRVESLATSTLYGFKKWTGHELLKSKPDYLSSWCMLISREVWHKIGKFDEAFTPMYFEDIDYCIRAAKEGIPLIEFDRDEWGIVHLYMDKEQARADFKEKKAELLNSLMNYLKEKHGIE